jgi:hypothetical protein
MKNSVRKYQKALETVVFVASREQRLYWALKAIYFADKEHLRRYGRQIFDDSYRAMKFGPVPSLAYDIVKIVRGDGWIQFTDPNPADALHVPDKYTILPKREPDTRLLSKSDIECLVYGCNEVKNLDFEGLHIKSQDDAYKAVELDEDMTIVNIIGTLDNSEEVLDYLKEN